MNDEKIIDFYNTLLDVEYGWYDNKGNLYENIKDGNFLKDYQMQNIDNLLKSKHAICWELCELERQFFLREEIPFMTVFAILKGSDKFPCHTFLIYKLNQKYYWFEASWVNKKGIKEYNSCEEIFKEIAYNFEDFTKTKDYDVSQMAFYKYEKPQENITCVPFYNHCMKEENEIISGEVRINEN